MCFPNADLESWYSIMFVAVVSKHTKSTEHSHIHDTTSMKLTIEDSFTEKINPFDLLPITLN